MKSKTQYPSVQPYPSSRNNQAASKGLALLLVLWVMAVLSAIALQMNFASRLRTKVTINTAETAKAMYFARAGIQRAISDLADGIERLQPYHELHGTNLEGYRNAPISTGTYTLFAGIDNDGNILYGLTDEASKIDLNTADNETLLKLPGFTTDLVNAIEDLKSQQRINDINDLLLLDQIDRLTLYGEDQNRNGLLDTNEDDGDNSWPPDNADGQLELGIARYLTTWSAARNVSIEGDDRIDISSANAQTIASGLPGISEQQAQSIVAHRGNQEFSTILDLLDVELIEQTETPSANNQQNPQQPNGNPQASNPQSRNPQDQDPRGRTQESPNPQASNPQQGTPPGNGPQNANQQNRPQQEGDNQQPRSTGQKAFDMGALRNIADLVTVTDDKFIAGVLNINTASEQVLSYLPGIDLSLARAIVHAREGKENGFATPLDLLDVQGVSNDLLKQLYPRISTRSDVFTVRSFGVLANGKTHYVVSAVLDRTGDKVTIRYWEDHS